MNSDNTKPVKCIPPGLYCYKILNVDRTTGRLTSEYCPYFGHYYDRSDNEWRAYCAFVEDEDATLLDDSCKICGENDDVDPEDFY